MTTTTVLNIGITGKQNILPTEVSFVYNSIKSKIDEILKKHQADSFIGYSAMARGADTIFAEVVTKEFKQPLKIILPYDVDEYRQSFTQQEDLAAFNSWIKKYHWAQVIDEGKITRNEQKNYAYEQTGKFLVESCDEVIIVWDKLRPSGQGGTAEILGLIACTRPIKEINLIPIKAVNPDGFHAEINRQTQQVDDEASRLKRNYNLVWKSSTTLGWLAAVGFAVNAGFDNVRLDKAMSFVECILVFFMVVIISISKVRKYHLRFILQRIKAEKLRLIEIFYDANIRIDVKELLENNDDELSYLIQLANHEMAKNEYVSTHYSFYCVKNLVEKQEKYHQSFLRKKELKRTHWYETAKKIIIALFLFNLLLSFVDVVMTWFQTVPSFTFPHGLSVFISIFLSACFAAVETTLFFREWGILKKNSAHMLEYFRNEKKYLEKNYTRIKPEELLKEISVKMLTDNETWDAIFRGKPEEVKLF